MTLSEGSTPFDAAATATRLVGTWSYPSKEEPSGIGYIHLHGTGIALYFVHAPHQPEQPIRVRLSYSLESASVMRVRNITDGSDGWTNQYQLCGDELKISNPNGSYLCTRVPEEDVPAWFQEAIAKYC